jgi:hypothetical protein
MAYPFRVGAPNVTTHAYHSVLETRSVVNGIPMHLKFSVTYLGYTQPTGAGSYQGSWTLIGLTAIHAPENQMAATENIGAKIIFSARFTPEFFAKYKRVSDLIFQQVKAREKATLQLEMQQVVASRAQPIASGGASGHIMDEDDFMASMAVQGLKSKLFSASIGNPVGGFYNP